MKNKKLKYYLCIANFLTTSILGHTDQNYSIKLYTFFTQSHAVFKDNWFLPSFKDDYEVIIKEFQQECPTGEYRSRGWNQTMMHKVEMIIDAIEQNWGNIVIYSDMDIQFFQPTKAHILKALETKDIAFQIESPSGDIGAGFFALIANKKTFDLFNEVKKLMLSRHDKTDQLALNYILRRPHNLKVKWGYLPETFFAGGTLTGTVWNPDMKLKLPKDIVLHHGNSTVGIKNKIAQLEYVKSKIKKQKTL